MRSLGLSNELKRSLFSILDLLFLPCAWLAGAFMRFLQRYGIYQFKLVKKSFLRIGIYPLQRHYYEPLFHPGDLRGPLDQVRPLPGIDLNAEGQLKLLAEFSFQDEIQALGASQDPIPIGNGSFTIDNGNFMHGDVSFYYNVIRHFRPKRIVEIGSGNSTKVALMAAQANERQAGADFETEIVAIEPSPWFRHPRLELIESRVENVGTAPFENMAENDILFIDSSHMIRPQGDVLYEFLELLPKLNPGVIVQIHDIFTPFDYPEEWVVHENRFWNEQYLLEAFLSGNREFEIIGALYWLNRTHHEAFVEACPLAGLPGAYPPHSWWMRKLPPRGPGDLVDP